MTNVGEQGDLKRILVKGGVLSAGELRQIAEYTEALGYSYINFGSRQDILLPYNESIDSDVLNSFPSISVDKIQNANTHNIVSAYAAVDILTSHSWVSGSTYLYILEQFQEKTNLEINITDPNQRLVPLFSGHLNFIASEHEDYWFLYLRLPNWQGMKRYPVLVYSWDISTVTNAIESVYQDALSVNDLFEDVCREIDVNSRTIQDGLNIPFEPFPYYEGINRQDADHYWLGLYWRNNRYDTAFLKELCTLCLESKIGKISLTPWKSLIIKRIPATDKLKWEKLLGRFGINVRHSSLELNWHLPVEDKSALELKKFLVQKLDQKDISTYGLTIGIKSSYSVNFTSLVIQQNKIPESLGQFNPEPTFNLLYAEQFDVNSLNYLTYAQEVDKRDLPLLLMELSRLYFEQLGQIDEVAANALIEEPQVALELPSDVLICQNCDTQYDSRFGDAHAGIPSGVPFDQLPTNYQCSVCEADKGQFKKQS